MVKADKGKPGGIRCWLPMGDDVFLDGFVNDQVPAVHVSADDHAHRPEVIGRSFVDATTSDCLLPLQYRLKCLLPHMFCIDQRAALQEFMP